MRTLSAEYCLMKSLNVERLRGGTFDNGTLLKNTFFYHTVSNKSSDFINRGDLSSYISTTVNDAHRWWNGIDDLITILLKRGLNHVGHHFNVQQSALVTKHALELHIHCDLQVGATQPIKKRFYR